MKCHACGGEMKIAKVKSYEYKECGLPTVLLSGINRHTCRNCREEYVDIPKINQLHRLIGMTLCCRKEKLSGIEIRYLRKEMGLRAIDFARVLSIQPETLSRIENDTQDAGDTLEKFMRSAYMNLVSAEQEVPIHLNYIKIFAEAAKLPKAPGKKIRLKPEEWINTLSSSSCPERCAAH